MIIYNRSSLSKAQKCAYLYICTLICIVIITARMLLVKDNMTRGISNMNIFKTLTIDDYDIINQYVKESKQKACDYTAANLVLWGEFYQTQYLIAEDILILKFKSDGIEQFAYPIGGGSVVKAIDFMKEYCEENGIELRISKVEPEMFEYLEQVNPGRFVIEYDRDSFDYVYRVEDLQKLSGKKYHGKKNHINKFKKEHPEWSYEPITADNKKECIEMVKQWCIENGCCEDADKAAEICIVIRAILNMERLNLKGGLVRTEEEIVAITLGEEVDESTFVIHFEKAFARVQGAYPIINQQFIENELMGYEFVNREEDLGIEGLRKAKESYNPIIMVEKGIVMEKETAALTGIKELEYAE